MFICSYYHVKKKMQAPVKNFCAEVSRLANAIASEKNFIAEMSRLANPITTEKNFISVVSRLANAFTTEENFRARIVGRVRVFFVCVSGMMKAG